jgi:spore maturation protein CgeB
MRILENRTGNTVSKPLRILSILRGQWDHQRAPALQALADIGHEVVYVDELLPLDGYRKLVQRLDFDVAVLWGSSLQNFLNSFEGIFFLEEMGLPYVSLWTDNPIKHLALLKNIKTPLHRGLFVADTVVIEQLEGLGWDNVFYLPPWHIDPDIFKPVEPVTSLTCDLSFAATINSLAAEKVKWRQGWRADMNAAADNIIELARTSKDHVDVFDAVGKDWDATTDEFSQISHAMYFEQKALAREQLIHAVGDRELHIVGIGSVETDRDNVIMHEGREWHDLSPLFCSTLINLNLTPWPRSCHHRLFQIAASGAFILSDWREDALTLFEPDVEAVYFKSLDELPALIDRYLRAPDECQKIAQAARQRFLAEHTAAHRMAELSARLNELL